MTTYQPASDRYDVSDQWFRRCGRSGLLLPALSLGCWNNFGAPGTDAMRNDSEEAMHENCRRMIFTAFDNGITHFDLANNYGPPPGAAEQRFGRIFKELPREEVVISTKAGFAMWPGPYGEWGSRKNLLESLDQSLKRLDVDHVDIFYHHRPDPDTPLDESLGALDTAVKSGKALYAGISNYQSAMLEDAVRVIESASYARPIIHQPNYSIFNRWVEEDGLLDVTDDKGLGVIAFCPLAGGLLTNKYLNGIPEHSRAASKSIFMTPERVTPEIVAKVRKLNALAESRGQSLAQMSLCWVLRDRRVTTALIGASRPEQIIENVKALDNATFSDDELKQIDEIAKD